MNRNNEKKLKPLLKSGREKIAGYAVGKGFVKGAEEVVGDKSPPPYNDLPCGEWTGLKC